MENSSFEKSERPCDIERVNGVNDRKVEIKVEIFLFLPYHAIITSRHEISKERYPIKENEFTRF